MEIKSILSLLVHVLTITHYNFFKNVVSSYIFDYWGIVHFCFHKKSVTNCLFCSKNSSNMFHDDGAVKTICNYWSLYILSEISNVQVSKPYSTANTALFGCLFFVVNKPRLIDLLLHRVMSIKLVIDKRYLVVTNIVQ